jgi:hypothetical protein
MWPQAPAGVVEAVVAEEAVEVAEPLRRQPAAKKAQSARRAVRS